MIIHRRRRRGIRIFRIVALADRRKRQIGRQDIYRARIFDQPVYLLHGLRFNIAEHLN